MGNGKGDSRAQMNRRRRRRRLRRRRQLRQLQGQRATKRPLGSAVVSWDNFHRKSTWPAGRWWRSQRQREKQKQKQQTFGRWDRYEQPAGPVDWQRAQPTLSLQATPAGCCAEGPSKRVAPIVGGCRRAGARFLSFAQSERPKPIVSGSKNLSTGKQAEGDSSR